MLFTIPQPAGKAAEGSADENPLHLLGLSCVDIERFLGTLYPSVYGTYKAHTIDEWTSILNLSTMWDFSDVRKLAIRKLQALSMDPVDKIILSRKYRIHGEWTIGAYTTLCERREPLTIPEASRLGLETAIRIAQIREQIRSCSTRTRGPYQLLSASAIRRGPPDKRPSPRISRPRWEFGKGPAEHTSNRSGTPNTGKALTNVPGTTRLVADVFGLKLT
ncbi:uncharacterized protein FIBRA_05106 [Fibroporia radiculosa]|uniref:Uncharacterized protein n=1 Tax=Fibroporia radiculosa TaxID=599839 RepID=J4IAI9_9APHY|nr:uncharacterized protein FIBRA_05106 [Fibroporia radiculosa]CCM02991.1 predicted protein [Fibroporia radiculosa]